MGSAPTSTESKRFLAFQNGHIMIEIYTDNSIAIDGKKTGLKVTQNQCGTVVYQPEPYKEFQLPNKRYSLAHDKPISGAPGRKQFETDIKELIETL